ncbi:IgaA/UmoB family intracellular growth attenuator [Stenotrophomonas sp. SY1]|uniref:IgaA/UmoB family intracellular growth attenuator n=1 Tax=Stenotrophomonas sp. SY1 TaxID=477235 RepID=UPI001E3BB6CA|nr:IgaA/UmoB family intracellular growth attenuator [Stenotrophomonas sp. SY1]MCD9085267.1 intracellular growth attenuator family protein [Stenotrophomonas sp. SY1]
MQALRGTQPIRTLDDDERQAMEPLRRAHQVNFVSGQVFRLSGNYLRHGISTNGGETMHDTIGGVEVLLPFDAASFLDAHNEAEVVITAKHAVVVRLNGFHVLEGQRRQQEQNAQEQAWEAGQAMTTAGEPHSGERQTPDSPFADDSRDVPLDTVEMLSQRRETVEEAEEGTFSDKGFIAAWFWLLGFMVLYLTSGQPAWPWLAIPFMAVAIWLPRRAARKAVDTSGSVNQLHGPLNLIMASDQHGKVSTHLLLGESRQVGMPDHWLQSGRIAWGQSMHMDVRTRDSRVLGLGRGWSLTEEQRRFPRIRWGRHITLLGAALIGLLLVSLNSDSLAKDINLARFSLFGSEVRTDSSAASLQQNPPRPGDHIQLQGLAHCELALAELSDSAGLVVLPDCSRMRWGGQPVTLPELALPEPIAHLQRADFLESVEDPMARMMDAMLPRGENSIEAILARANRPNVILIGMARMIDAVEAACETGLEGCQALQTELVGTLGAHLDTDSSTPLNSWPVLAREVRQLAESDDDHMRTRKERIHALRSIMRAYANRHLLQQLQTLTPQLLSVQQGGVVLIAPHDLQVSTNAEADDPQSTDMTNLSERWEQARTLAAHAVPFAINGVVVDRHDDAGGLRLEVDTATDTNPVGIAWVNTLWLLLAMTLVIYHAMWLYRRIRQARARTRALAEDMQKRPAPGGI